MQGEMRGRIRYIEYVGFRTDRCFTRNLKRNVSDQVRAV